MDNIAIIFMIIILLLVIALLVYAFKARKGKTVPPDYRSWFWIGLSWVVLGLVMAATQKIPVFVIYAGFGLFFMVVGWMHKDEWREQKKFSEMTSAERRFKLIFLVILGLVLVGGLVYFLLAG